MATPQYPEGLPGVTTWGLQPGSQIAETEGEAPPYAARRRSRMPRAFGKATWVFMETEYKQFVTWWKTNLKRGLKWFWAELPSAGGITWHLVRFHERYRHELSGFRCFTVTATLEIRDRAFGPRSLPETEEPVSLFTWDPENLEGAIALTNGNLTATYTPLSVTEVRSTETVAGKIYFEIEVGTISFGARPNARIGIVTSETELGTYLDDMPAYVMWKGTGLLSVGDSTGADVEEEAGSWSEGDILMFAIDFVEGNMWVGENGTWFNAADPAAGTVPTFIDIPDADWYGFAGMDGSDPIAHTAIFTAPFNYTPPTGFGAP